MSEERDRAYRHLRRLKKIKRTTRDLPGKEKIYRKAKKAIRAIKEQFGFK